MEAREAVYNELIGEEQDLREYNDEREQGRQRAEEKLQALRDGRSPADLEGDHVLIVDDGVATGATMRACIRTAKAGDATRVTVAVPVAPATSIPELEREADDVIALRTPERFRAVGHFYRTFEQVPTISGGSASRYRPRQPRRCRPAS